MKTHVVDDDEFASLAAGYGSAEGIAALHAAQISRRYLLLRYIQEADCSEVFESAYALMSVVQATAPDVVRRIVGSPAFGTWSALTARAIRQGDRFDAIALAGQLSSFAVSAAITAGAGFTLDVPTVGGAVFLPGLGQATVADAYVTADGKAGDCRLGDVDLPADLSRDTGRWQALRQLTVACDGLRLQISFDDLDPWRDNHGLSAAGRCSTEEIAQWQNFLDEAWQILVRHHRRYAEAMSAGLTTIVPLVPPSSGNTINATSMWAFGSVSLTTPTSGRGLASSLLHEFQHAKLGALLDVYRFYDDDSARRHYAPWRDDPRPLGGVLQGVYAFLGVTDFWRVQRRVLDGADAKLAEVEFARWRAHVWQTFQQIEQEPAFTDIGRAFLRGLRATQEVWLAESVSDQAAALAEGSAEDHWTGWRLRNVRADEEMVRRLALAWSNGDRPVGEVTSRIVPNDVRARARNPRLDLAVMRVNDPDKFAGECAQPRPTERFSPPDIAFARGDFPAAVAGYRQQINADPGETANWVGLALACRRVGESPSRIWRDRPELPFAVYHALRDAGKPLPDPVCLGEWLDHVGGGSTTQ